MDWRSDVLQAVLMALFGLALIFGAFALLGRALTSKLFIRGER